MKYDEKRLWELLKRKMPDFEKQHQVMVRYLSASLSLQPQEIEGLLAGLEKSGHIKIIRKHGQGEYSLKVYRESRKTRYLIMLFILFIVIFNF